MAEDMPQEIIVEILTRLPAKSVGKFRCVSKHWNSLLSNPKFIKAHCTHHSHKQVKLISVSRKKALRTISLNPQNGNDGFSKKLHFKKTIDNWVTVQGSCDGLVLLHNENLTIFLVNPTTLEYHRIPEIEALPAVLSFRGTGLGYDFATDDYKLVTLARYNICNVRNESRFTYVYSVRKGLWSKVENSAFDRAELVLDSGVFANGAMHWVASGGPSTKKKKKNSEGSWVIIAFNLTDETFLEVPSPTTIDTAAGKCYSLETFRGCLCMFGDTEVNKMDIWIMKEYGVAQSWTKFSVTRPASSCASVPLCLLNDDDVVLDVYKDAKVIVSNMKEHKWRDLMVDGIPAKFKSTATFTESLISPMFSKGTKGNFIA